MTREIDLRRAIIDDPDNDDLRLVYADWCEEHGDPERAEFIRLQIQLATGRVKRQVKGDLRRREAALYDDYAEHWLRQVADDDRLKAELRTKPVLPKFSVKTH